MKSFPLITLTASTPYERGLQYGAQAKQWIDICVDHYRSRFLKQGHSWKQISDYAMGYIPPIEAHAPLALEEARGIAEGSGHTLEEIMVVNCRYEISKFPTLPECTTAAVLPPATADGKTFIVKNWDYSESIIPHVVLLLVKDETTGTSSFGVTEAGQLVRDGVNAQGVAFVNNNLQSIHDHPGIGLPATFIRQLMWECETFEQACEVVVNADRCVSCNTLIAAKGGHARNFEAYPGGADLIDPTDGILVHANHFVVSPELDAITDRPKNRDARLRELLETKHGAITAAHIMDCMKDHKYLPLSICGHPDKDGDNYARGRVTVSSMVADLTDGIVYFCAGNPCEGEFVEYRL